MIFDELKEYSNKIKRGDIIACQKHRWACERFLNDLERAENDDTFPFEFVNAKAEHYLITWMPLFTHSKGVLAGQPKKPTDYEKFVYGNIYGWWHKKTKSRRFRRSYEQIARKNAKSQDKAIQSLYEISELGEGKVEAYIAAMKKEQTRHVWGEAKWLIENSVLKDSFTCKFNQEMQQVCILHKRSSSTFSRLSKDDKKIGDGTCPNFFVIDEYHLHETTEYYDLASSGQKTLKNPLLSIITTAGFDMNNPCRRVEYEYVSKLLNPNSHVKNERYFAIICEAEKDEETGKLKDDITSEAARLKSNPIIGDTETGKESIEMEIAEALDKPEKMRDVLTKTLNIWIQQRNFGYMNAEKWTACAATKDNPFPDVIGKRAFCGLDLSATTDLTSVGFDIPLEGGLYAVLHHSFVPEEKLTERRRKDNVPYDLWIQQGYMTETPGATIDHHFVLDYIVKAYEEHDWPKDMVCFDAALSTWLMQELMDRGFTGIEIAQSYSKLSLPTKDFRAKCYDKKIIHNGDPVLAWAIYNAVTRAGPSENIMLDKAKSKERIDPLACLINAHAMAMLPDNSESPYSEQGLRSLT